MKTPVLFLCLLLLPGADRPARAAGEAPFTSGRPIEIAGTRGGFGQLTMDLPRRRLLLAHAGNGTLDVLDLRTERVVASVKTGSARAVSPAADGKTYLVSTGPDKKLVFVDAEKLVAAGEVPLPGEAGPLIPGPTGVNRIFVARADAPELWVVNPGTKTVTSTVLLPAVATGILADDATSSLYLTLKAPHQLLMVSASDHNTTPGGAWPVAPAKAPQALALDTRDPRRIFVAGFNGRLVALDTSGRVLGSTAVATGVEHLAHDAAHDLIFCASSSGRMTVIRTAQGGLQPAGEFTAPRGSTAVAVDPATHDVWTAYTEGGRSFALKFTPRR